MSDTYILIGQTPVPASSIQWARWFEHTDRRVAMTRLFDLVEVSTVFLGLDHAFGGGEPILFESMAFWAGEGGYEQTRCHTWMEAEAQHRKMVAEVAKPRSVWAYIRRMARQTWFQMRFDWRIAWKEFRGQNLSEVDSMLIRLDALKR